MRHKRNRLRQASVQPLPDVHAHLKGVAGVFALRRGPAQTGGIRGKPPLQPDNPGPGVFVVEGQQDADGIPELPVGHGVRLGLVGANSHGPYPAACRMVAEDGVQFPLHDNERPEIGISAFWKQQHGLGTGAGQFQILRRASSVLSLLDVLIRAANPQVDQLTTLERGDHDAARNEQPCLVLAVPLLRRKPKDGTRPEPSGLAVLASQIAEAVRPDDLFRNAALRQPVERLGMIPDFGLGFGQQLRRVVPPLLRRHFLD